MLIFEMLYLHVKFLSLINVIRHLLKKLSYGNAIQTKMAMSPSQIYVKVNFFENNDTFTITCPEKTIQQAFVSAFREKAWDWEQIYDCTFRIKSSVIKQHSLEELKEILGAPAREGLHESIIVNVSRCLNSCKRDGLVGFRGYFITEDNSIIIEVDIYRSRNNESIGRELVDKGLGSITCTLTISFDKDGGDDFLFYDSDMPLKSLSQGNLNSIQFRNTGKDQHIVFSRSVRIFFKTFEAFNKIKVCYVNGMADVLSDKRSVSEFSAENLEEFEHFLLFLI